MRSGKNILKLLLAWVLWGTILSGCAGGPVTEVEPCVEIPFLDGPEGACTNTVTHKAYLVNSKDWIEQRPLMIMIRSKDWTKIKLAWLKACRLAGPDCNVAVDSVDTTIKALDQLAGSLIKLP